MAGWQNGSAVKRPALGTQPVWKGDAWGAPPGPSVFGTCADLLDKVLVAPRVGEQSTRNGELQGRADSHLCDRWSSGPWRTLWQLQMLPCQLHNLH